ncbi:MAG: IS3 family transposase [Thiobacillus sp.]|nr:IS3 family transposase [Thiobacillus sp.]
MSGPQDNATLLTSLPWQGWPSATLISRSSFHASLNRKPSKRSQDDEDIGAKVWASFIGFDRTYGARRVWHDVLADGVNCGLHRIELLMQAQALRARRDAPHAASGVCRVH